MSDRTVWQLARLAECADPDTFESAGAKFLIHVEDAVAEALEADELDEDRIHEIADSAPDVYTFQRWLEFVDLAAWQEDLDDYVPDPSMSNDMSAMAGVALYMIAERLVRALAEDAA